MGYTNERMPPWNEQSAALGSLSQTGALPHDAFWDSLRAKDQAHPMRFTMRNPVQAALLARDAAQTAGTATAMTPILPHTPFFDEALRRHEINPGRFDRNHPFLGKLIEVKLPVVTPPPPPGGTMLPPPPPPPPPPVPTPEPSTLALCGIAISVFVVKKLFRS